VAAIVLGLLLAVAASSASAAAGDEPAVSVLPLRPDIYLLTVQGENLVLGTGPDGAILVNTGPAAAAKAVIAAIHALTRQPLRLIINTSGDPEAVGGNGELSAAGQAFASGVLGKNAPIVAHENAMLNMVAAPNGKYAAKDLPNQTFTRSQKNLYLNGQAVEVIHEPAAHSNGDVVVLFRGSDVLVAGNLIDMNRFPVIDLEHGGSIQGEIDALNKLLDVAVSISPLVSREGGTVVVPARGYVGAQAEVLNYRDMLTIIRDRIQDLLRQGKTLAQIQAAHPTAGFTTRFGATEGAWTTERFVEAVYLSLTAGLKKK
jgi:glyoxylase-like metal-dependent hydrolase (beta-lactamase superfamily II)